MPDAPATSTPTPLALRPREAAQANAPDSRQGVGDEK